MKKLKKRLDQVKRGLTQQKGASTENLRNMSRIDTNEDKAS